VLTNTYEELQEAWKREFHNQELMPLKQDFFKDIASYVKRLKEASRNLDAKSLKAILIEEESQRLNRLLIQLLDRRMEKLWAQSESIQSMMLESPENQAYKEITDLVRLYQKVKEALLQGREPSSKARKDNGPLMIRFVKDVPSIIGVDLKTHGPFTKEDIAKLPYENAESLIRQGAAVEIGPSAQDNE
jgi:DNA replication initiation complex subunit (GINS family)